MSLHPNVTPDDFQCRATSGLPVLHSPLPKTGESGSQFVREGQKIVSSGSPLPRLLRQRYQTPLSTANAIAVNVNTAEQNGAQGVERRQSNETKNQ
jgi:hypothetical protein